MNALKQKQAVSRELHAQKESRQLIVLKGLCLKLEGESLTQYIESRRSEFSSLEMPSSEGIERTKIAYASVIKNYKGE